MNSPQSLFEDHIRTLQDRYLEALAGAALDGAEAVLIHSGSEQEYFGDDRIIPFQAWGHFRHWLPVNRPDQLLYIKPGNKPVYYQVIPDDYWYDQSITVKNWWADCFEIIRLGNPRQLSDHLTANGFAYLGPNRSLATQLGVDESLINPDVLIQPLDFQRAYKTEYEIVQLREANRRGLLGHDAARRRFLEGGNEYDIHRAFLDGSGQLEEETPYTTIVALDEKAAILHYQYKRRGPAQDSRVLLIDAGCRVNGYGSDITRTSAKPQTDGLFVHLLKGMEAIEGELVGKVRPGIPYTQIHQWALEKLCALLVESDICRGKPEEMMQTRVPHLFMPHGVGHLLGIQVHDVGGRQRSPGGGLLPPPDHSPALRNTRTLAENMVFTIEPGCYFIPMLLERERNNSRGKLINWPLIDRLYPCGGIRVEDNVRVTTDGVENLTRCFE